METRAQGLRSKEVEKLRKQYGENVLPEEKPPSLFMNFLSQLKDPLIYILFCAAGISLFLHELYDAIIILAVILLDAVVGVIQEGKARHALESLKKLTTPMALVVRDGVEQEIQAKELVPGDLVILEAGCQVPADLKLTESHSLQAMEAALTGESVPASKSAGAKVKSDAILDQVDSVFMSTVITYGRGRGIVTATGVNTQIGKIAAMIHGHKEETTPLQKRLGDLGKVLSVLAVGLCVILFVVAVLQKRDVLDMMITAISLAVAAVPEGLPAVVTIVLALSVTRMVQVHTIVKRLPAVETLGAVTVVCSDKTGTLTENRMRVVSCYVAEQEKRVEELTEKADIRFLQGMLLCNDAVGNGIGDPTEIALVDMGLMAGMSKSNLDSTYPRLKELPFDSGRKCMTTLHRFPTGTISFTKGAPDKILAMCDRYMTKSGVKPMSVGVKRSVAKQTEKMSGRALRVLALAMAEGNTSCVEKGLIWIGMAGMEDPVRKEAVEAVLRFQGARVRTVMITGDHVDTAFAVARQLGITNRFSDCMTGEEIDNYTDKQFRKEVEHVRVFARVSPEHKVRIVKALKGNGHTVAMTGDGVNDAPSLQAADVGIAMGMSGTDVAKGAADLILTDDNFASIEKAMGEGRGIYENIKKAVLFLLSSNTGELLTMFVTVCAGLAAPLKASHILWINLITDTLPALALGVDKNDTESLMHRKPRKASESLFAHGGMLCTCFYGLLIGAITLVAFLKIPVGAMMVAGQDVTLQGIMEIFENKAILARAQTYAFTVLAMSQLFHAIGMRNVEISVFHINHLENRLMILAFVTGLLLQVAVTEVAVLAGAFGTVRLAVWEWISLLILSMVPLLAHELLALFNHE